MEHTRRAYIIDSSAYLYIQDSGDSYDYTFYTPRFQVMETGEVKDRSKTIEEALDGIFQFHYLKPENIVALSESEIDEMIEHIDDYNIINRM